MSEEINAGEIRVAFTGDLSGLQEAFTRSKSMTKDLTQDLGNKLKDFGKTVVAAFAVEKIIEFSVSAVEEFAKVERGVDVLIRQLKNNAAPGWDKLRGSVEAFLTTQAEVYGTAKDQQIQALDSVQLKTHNLAASMKLLDDAEKLSLITGHSMSEEAQILAQAYDGLPRGLKSLGRELGLQTSKTVDAGVVFKELGKQLKGIEQVTEDTEGKIKTAGAAWREFSETLGKVLAPIARDVLTTFTSLTKAITGIFQAKTYSKESYALSAELFRINTEFSANISKMGVQAAEELRKKQTAAAQATYDATAKVEEDSTNKVKIETDKQIAAHAKAAEAAIKAKDLLKESVKSELELIQKEVSLKSASLFSLFSNISRSSTTLTQKAGEDLEHFKARVKDLDESTKAWASRIAEVIKKFGDLTGGEISTSFQTFVKNVKEGTASMQDGFKVLGQAIGRSIIKALAEGLTQQGVARIAQGVADLLNPLTAPMAPGDFAAGAGLSAAGGAMMGVADAYLAQGGIVTKPTLAMVGEGGQSEAVVPLDRAGDFGFGGGAKIGTIEIHNHGVKDMASFNSHATRQSMTRTILEVTDKARVRSGKRTSTSY